MNLTGWAYAQGIHVTTAYRWYREGTLPVPVRKAGRLILVSPDTAAAASLQGGAGLYARVSCHDQKAAWTARSPVCRRGRCRPACPWSGWRPGPGPG